MISFCYVGFGTRSHRIWSQIQPCKFLSSSWVWPSLHLWNARSSSMSQHCSSSQALEGQVVELWSSLGGINILYQYLSFSNYLKSLLNLKLERPALSIFNHLTVDTPLEKPCPTDFKCSLSDLSRSSRVWIKNLHLKKQVQLNP